MPRITAVLLCLGMMPACAGPPGPAGLQARPYPITKSKVVPAVVATMQELGLPLDRVTEEGKTVAIASKAGADSYALEVIVMENNKTTVVQPQVLYPSVEREQSMNPTRVADPSGQSVVYRNFFAKLEEHLKRMKSLSR